jgi:hypothetical protein
MKTNFSIFLITLMLVGCGSTPTQNEATKDAVVSIPQNNSNAEPLSSFSGTNTFKDIPVEVIGIPMDYNYPAIGRHAKFVTLPNGKEPLKGVCDDYSKLLIWEKNI